MLILCCVAYLMMITSIMSCIYGFTSFSNACGRCFRSSRISTSLICLPLIANSNNYKLFVLCHCLNHILIWLLYLFPFRQLSLAFSTKFNWTKFLLAVMKNIVVYTIWWVFRTCCSLFSIFFYHRYIAFFSALQSILNQFGTSLSLMRATCS